jgi:uncharacterized metal-binding protein YceD (DUF177 family)
MNPLDWLHSLAEIPRARRAFTRQATAQELETLARALELPAVNSLDVRYGLAGQAPGSYALDGTLTARVVQTCVVSLEPFETIVEVPLAAEFRDGPAEPAVASADTAEVEILALPDIEPIEDGQLDIGRVVFESLAAGLDPNPRKPDATFSWTDSNAGNLSPFAALAKLKRDPG